jgi:hypothetical protein
LTLAEAGFEPHFYLPFSQTLPAACAGISTIAKHDGGRNTKASEFKAFSERDDFAA